MLGLVSRDIMNDNLKMNYENGRTPKRNYVESEDDEIVPISRKIKRTKETKQAYDTRSNNVLSSSEEEEEENHPDIDKQGKPDDESCKQDTTELLLNSLVEIIALYQSERSLNKTKHPKSLKKKLDNAYSLGLRVQSENRDLRRKFAKNDNINNKLSSLTAVITGAVATMTDLKAQIDVPKLSYAEKVRINNSVLPRQAIKPPKNIATIFPDVNSDITNSDETKRRIMSSVAPTEEKLKIRNLRKIGNNGCLIETHTKEDLDTVLKNQNLEKAGLKVGLPAKKKPRMIIHSIPNDAKEEEIIAAIKQQNLGSLPRTLSPEDFRILFKTGDKRKETSNWVVEVSPDIRDIFKNGGRVFVGWHSCFVKDYTAVSRCYKCQSFGHISKYCRATIDTCGHCALDGHTYQNCPSAKQNPSCVNCKRANKPHDHSSRSRDCPAYLFATQSYISKIDYGRQ